MKSLLCVACLLIAVAACGKKDAPAAARAQGGKRALSFPVQVVRVESRPVEYAVTAVGSVEAFETVRITARVPGAVERVRFSEGDQVKLGQVLVEIEPRRYRLAVEAARATLEKTRAGRAGAETGLKRREEAVSTSPGLIPSDEITTFRTRLRTSEAEVAEAQAALSQAQLNLQDAYVRAPLAGVIETRTVETGQYIQVGTVLGTLLRRDPLLVRFKVPASDAAQIRPNMSVRFTPRDDGRTRTARISHVTQAADPTSRMVSISAEVTAADREQLRPGAFAEVVVPIGGTRSSAVLPQTAVRPTERGFVAFVIEGKVARERTLALGLRTGEGGVEVREGIKAGDLVVVRGAEALRDGATVTIEKTGTGVSEDGGS